MEADRQSPLVFVADDDAATLDLMREVAEEGGWEMHGFRQLAGLRRALDQRRPALLILDDELPDGRGGDLARELRGDPRLREMRLMVVTAAQPMRQAEIGAWAPVISKPFDVDVIERFLADAAADADVNGGGDGDAYGTRAG